MADNKREFDTLLLQYKLLSDHKRYESQLKASLLSSFLTLNGIMIGVVALSDGIGYKFFAAGLAFVGSFALRLVLMRSGVYIKHRDDQMEHIEDLLKNEISSFEPLLSIKPKEKSIFKGGISATRIINFLPSIAVIVWILVILFYFISEVDINHFISLF